MATPDTRPALDLSAGVPIARLAAEPMVAGKLGDEEVLLVRQEEEYFAVGARCTHYSGPLAEGLVVGDEVRCPLHHACFSLRTGEPLRAPALDPIPCWRVERVGDRVFVREKLPGPAPRKAPASAPSCAGTRSMSCPSSSMCCRGA